MLITPNILSIIRLCLVPVFIWVFNSTLEHARLWATGIYVLASATDVLDGWMARKYNLTSELGRFLDPLGDKLLLASMLYCLARVAVIPYWALGIYVAKEIILGAGSLFLHRRAGVGVPASNLLGKTATVIFFLVCILLAVFDTIPGIYALMMITTALVISVSALLKYIAHYASLLKAPNTDVK